MNNRPPISEGVPGKGPWPATWGIWLGQVFDCLPWRKAFNVTATINFGSVAAHGEAASPAISITGVRQGDAVEVTPYANTTGVFYAAVVTANDRVTVYAKNFTAGAIDPASMQFRIIVKQN